MAPGPKGVLYGQRIDEAVDAPVTGDSFVKYTPGGAGSGVSQCGLGDFPDGVALWGAGASGQPTHTTIQLSGIAHVMSGGAVTASALVMSDASGNAIPYTVSGSQKIAGKARTGCTTSGVIIEVLMYRAPTS